MEVDSVVALESHFTKLEVASSIGTISGATNLFGGAKGSKPFNPLPLQELGHFSMMQLI